MKKKKKSKQRKQKQVRTRDWSDKHEQAFSHDRAKHRRALGQSKKGAEARKPLPDDFTPNAVVVSHAKKWAFVDMQGGEHLCRIDERLKAEKETLLAPGDEVLVERTDEDEQPVVRGVAPRRTKLTRPAADQSQKAQVIAANIDVLVVVAATASPPFREGLVDRFLVAAQVGGVDPILCVNKIDLADTPPEALDIYRGLGVPVVLTSCETGEGIEALRDALRGKVAVFAGHSGVGKSTLLNALDPNLEVLTQPVGESTDRGKHTTTAARLYKLAGNIHVVDTPGIRSLGLWKVAPHELTWYFPDIAEAAQNCKFNDCTHLHEPDCAVRAAVENGGLPESRYASYVRIFESLSADDNITPGRLASSWQHGTRTDGG